jgi:hypothetical protein
VPSNRVICPHCGHDGTMETSRPPLGSYGFNYLAEGVVCREVRGFDENGRLRLSGDFKCEGSQATNARIECRSCWKTFPVPEGLLWAVVPEQLADPTEGPVAEPAQAEGPEGIHAAAGAISRSLVSVLRSMVHEVEQASAVQIARLDGDLAKQREQAAAEAAVQEQWRSRTTEVETALRAQEAGQKEIADRAGALAAQQEEIQRKVENRALAIAGLEEQDGQLRQAAAAEHNALKERMDGLDSGLQADREAAAQLRALCAQLQGECEALQQRLNAQADVIRALHGAALEQTTRREELRAAVQRLEELTGSLGQVKPLPEQL